MSEQTAKPYLIRAIYEWCSDSGLTPYLAVKVDAQTKVPREFVKNGEIVLNISAAATRHLTAGNDWIQFSARFGGVSQEVSVAITAVTGIFAKETGYGFAFAAPAAQVEGTASEPLTESKPATANGNGKGKPKLQVVK